jgi:hypothetical protein
MASARMTHRGRHRSRDPLGRRERGTRLAFIDLDSGITRIDRIFRQPPPGFIEAR